jgi:hypothetical protein
MLLAKSEKSRGLGGSAPAMSLPGQTRRWASFPRRRSADVQAHVQLQKIILELVSKTGPIEMGREATSGPVGRTKERKIDDDSSMIRPNTAGRDAVNPATPHRFARFKIGRIVKEHVQGERRPRVKPTGAASITQTKYSHPDTSCGLQVWRRHQRCPRCRGREPGRNPCGSPGSQRRGPE